MLFFQVDDAMISRKIFATFLFLFSEGLFACELTQVYIEQRKLFTGEMKRSYSACTRSVSTVEFWYRYSQCIESRDGENVGGGCAHVAERPKSSYKSLGINSDFCNSLKLAPSELQQKFQDYVESVGVQKCK